MESNKNLLFYNDRKDYQDTIEEYLYSNETGVYECNYSNCDHQIKDFNLSNNRYIADEYKPSLFKINDNDLNVAKINHNDNNDHNLALSIGMTSFNT